MDPTLDPSQFPAWAYVAATVTALGTLWSWAVAASSIVSRLLDKKKPDGSPLFNYPRLHAIVDEIALSRPKPSP